MIKYMVAYLSVKYPANAQGKELHLEIMAEKRKILIDCDPGTDDAHAIMMALASEDIELVAITTVFGNINAQQTTVNALRVLRMCGRTEVSCIIADFTKQQYLP